MIALAVIVLVACMALAPGSIIASDGTPMEDPHISLLLYFMYFQLIIAAVVTLISAVISFTIKLRADSKSAIIALAGVGAILLLCIITYAAGDDTPMTLIGYDGDENVGGYLKVTDMFLNTSYILCIIGIIAIILSPLSKRISK